VPQSVLNLWPRRSPEFGRRCPIEQRLRLSLFWVDIPQNASRDGLGVVPCVAQFSSIRTLKTARMIEVRPGLWVGSYQCITDLDRGGRDCSSGI